MYEATSYMKLVPMEQLSISIFLLNWPECDISNKPLEWTGLQKYLAPVLNPFLPLRASVLRTEQWQIICLQHKAIAPFQIAT